MELSIDFYILISALTAMFIVALSIPSINKVARAKNLYDVPDERKSHINSIPTLGGLAIFAGLIMSVLIWADFKSAIEIKYVLASIILIFFIGLKDDILIIAANKKLIMQVVATLILAVLGDVRITNLHGFLGISEIPYVVSILLSVFVTIVILNGMNLIDGIDGLASGVGIVVSLFFGVYFYKIGQFQYVILIGALIGSLIAFFGYNVFGKQNKIFMGDTGSLILGLVLAVFAIQFNEFNLTHTSGMQFSSAPAVSVGVLMVPLFDTIRVFIIRIAKGNSPFLADNNHVHHRLLQIGCSHIKATSLIIVANLLFIFLAVVLDGIGIWQMILIITSVATMLSVIPVLKLRYQRNKEIFDSEFIPKTYLGSLKLLIEDKSDRYLSSPPPMPKTSKKEYAEEAKVS